MNTLRAACLAAVAVAGCSSGGGEDRLIPPGETGGITIENASSVVLDGVYAEPSAGTVVFDSMLNTSGVLPGTTFPVTGLTPGRWSVLVETYGASADFIATAMNVDVPAGQSAWVTFTDAGFAGRVDVTNAGTSDVLAVRASPAGVTLSDRTWIAAPIPPGGTSLLLLHFPAGSWVVQCEFASGATSTGTYATSALTVTHVTCS